MALSAKQIRIGAVVSGRCGQRRFAGTVTEATDVTITVTTTAGASTQICPAWAEDLVVDGQSTPEPGPMATLTPKRITFKEFRPRLPANIADIERQRADKNYQAVTEWKAKRKPTKEDVPMLSKEEKKSKLLERKAEAIKKPIACTDCKNDFLRKALNAVRCDDCQVKHKKKLAKDYRTNHPRKPKAPVPPAPAEAGTPNAKPVADETCRFCGDYYFPGITGVNGQCRKCLDKEQAAAGMAPPADRKPSSEATKSKESTESIQPAPSSIPSAHSIPSIPSPSGRRRIGLVPITALERAHGQIQALWLEIARLQALVEG